MSKDKNTKDFLNYIANPLSRSSIDFIYSSNFVTFERCDLYRDFVLSLMTLVFDTYLGDKLTKEEQRLEHFKWCWKKTVQNFEEEGIYFGHNQELFNYFWSFMSEVYYSIENKDSDKNLTYNIVKLWKYIFNYQMVKTRSDIDTFIEVYHMFDKSLKNGKKT